MVQLDHHQPGHVCLTGCASTYNTGRRGSRALVSKDFGVIKEEEEDSIEEEAAKYFQKERRQSSFCLAKLAPAPPDPVEGNYKLIQCHDYEQYLAAVGTGPLSRVMVMRASVVVGITQELDKRWRIVTETAIKAKSMKGYATYTRKLTENKYKPGEAKPELVEDWDQRFLVTTLSMKPNEGGIGSHLLLEHLAEKDQKFCLDSSTVYQLEEEGDILMVTDVIGEVVAWRKFRRQESARDKGAGPRRHSIC